MNALTDRTRKGSFNWSDEAQKSFQDLKDAFQKAPLLVAFNLNRGLIVETDTSMTALTAIISQTQDNNHKHPVAFLSRKLNKAERAYVTHDQELLTIVQAFKTW